MKHTRKSIIHDNIIGQDETQWKVVHVADRVPAGADTKKLCERRGPFDYVIFRRSVKSQQFHTLNTHDTKPRTT